MQEEDRIQSLGMREEIKKYYLGILLAGEDGSEMLNPAFYKKVESDIFSPVTLTPFEENIAPIYYNLLARFPDAEENEIIARLHSDISKMQWGNIESYDLLRIVKKIRKYPKEEALAQLYFIALDANKDVGDFADENGKIVDRRAFYDFLGLGKNSSVEEDIIAARRIMLATKILVEKDEGRRENLIWVGKKIGLLDASGNWVDKDVYLAARYNWARMLRSEDSDDATATLNEYAATLLVDILTEEDDDQKERLVLELKAIGFDSPLL